MAQVQQTGSTTTTNTAPQLPPPTPYAEAVWERTANTRTWESFSYEMGPSGRLLIHTNRYVEMATSMNVSSNGLWVPASDQFSLTQNGAAATGGMHQLSILGDINTLGAVSLTLPEGDRKLISNILGLSYFDTASGQSVMIAVITNAGGGPL
jgi:hypothetical protein